MANPTPVDERDLQAAENSREVLQAEALRGERTTSLMRLGLWAVIFLVGFLTSFIMPTRHIEHAVLYSIYGALSVGYAIYVWRPRESVPLPLLVFMQITDVVVCTLAAIFGAMVSTNHGQPLLTVGQLCFFLAIASVRYSVRSLILTGVLVSISLGVLTLLCIDFPILYVGLLFGPVLGVGFVMAWIQQSAQRQTVALRSRDSLTRFLPKQVADRLLRDGKPLPGMRTQATVMFVDIRSFTAMSETLAPEQVLEFLNAYFANVVHLVFAHGGMVNKFIGDGMMAVWGVPDPLPDHAHRAVEAALAIRASVALYNAERLRKGDPAIAVGIGIHSGEVVAGNLGTPELIEYTVIGDTVNLASRLESVTKSHHVDLVLSGSTFEAVRERFSGRKLGDEQIRGKAQPVEVFTIEDAAKAAAVASQG